MGNIGFGELLVIFLVLLLVFGSSKLPQLGDALGKSIRNFKKATEDDAIDVTPKREELQKPAPASQPTTAAPAQSAPSETKR